MGILEDFKNFVHGYPQGSEESSIPEFSDGGGQAKARSGDTHQDKVFNIHTTTQLQVVLVKPERFDAASDIADHLRERRTVVLNLENANKDAIRRLVDFLSGVVYAQGGKIKPVAKNTYIITPYNVDILGGDLMDELESNGWYV